jgi:signal transduction histidine kinase
MLNRISIRYREVGTLVVLIIGFILVALFVYDSLRSIDASTRRVTKLTEDEVRLGEIGSNLDTLVIQLDSFIEEPVSAQDIDTTAGLTIERLAALITELRASGLGYPEVNVAQARFEQLATAVDSMIVQAQEDDQAVANLASQSLEDVRSLSGSYQVIEARVQDAVLAEVSVASDRVNSAIARTLAALLVLALISTLILVTNAYSITSGINTLTEGARELASPDTASLGVNFPPGRADEFARLGEVFNHMASAIRTQRIAIHNQLRQLEAARADAEAATEAKSDYLANMSHELRAPMHIIMNFTRVVLEGEAGEINEEQTKFLNRVMDSSNHLLAVINDVLDMARIEAGQLEIELADLDLSDLMDEMTVSAQALIEQSEKSIKFSVQVPDDLPNVFADERRVRQILLNLIGNAIRFTDKGGIKLTFGVGTDALTVCVEDSGVGIPSDRLVDIFDRFEQVSELDEERQGGTGLGLTIARDLTRLQGGRIWATSTPGKGSTFCFTLPRSKGRD